jgi:hypothetical protein
MSRPPHRVRRVVAALACVAVLLYAASYIYLSRRGVADARAHGLKYFLYVPVEDVMRSEDLSRHYLLLRLYAPFNGLDRELFGGPDPCRCISFGLSRGPDEPSGEPEEAE